ncbi:hypothetical protein [Cerasicoccus fimbriatus]|uniref:hypothetical protein n=1 Tax=Cerasicoccus fimbriatus TaxID=3014554 RepID=UPI0022B4B44B|nr:hypothetical protein [Cerasicoccus sp. TK19100]
MSDSNPDKPTPQSESEKERIAKIAASLPGEIVSHDAAFPKKRQRPKARLPETVRQKIETDVSEEAAKDKAADAPKAPAEKPKFKVTRSPFAPRIDQTAKPADTWGDEEETAKAEKKPEVAKKAEPEVAKKPEPVEKTTEPEVKKFEPKPIPRPTPTKMDISRAPIKAEAKAEPAKEEPKEAPKPAVQPAAKEAPKPAAKEEPKPVAKPAEEKPAIQQAKPAAKQPLPTPVAKAAPSKLPQPVAKKDDGAPAKLPVPSAKPAGSAPRTAPRPKAAPAPGRQAQQPVEEESSGMNIVWVAFDAVAAVASLVFAALVFMNMGG